MSDLAVPSSVARLNYFFGQLLTQRDLQAEQRFHLLLQRLMQRETLGTGTVAGLRVDAPTEAGVRGVFVRGGLALDPDGRELVLATDVCVVLADEALQPGQAGLQGDTYAALAASLASRWGAPIDETDASGLGGDLKAIGVVASSDAPTVRAALDRVVPPAGFVLPTGVTLREHLFDSLVGTTYLGVRYHERGAEPSPAVLDASCCGDNGCFPARIEEGVSIVMQAEPFPPIANPYADALASLDGCFGAEETTPPPDEAFPFLHNCRRCLCEYLLGAWRGVPNADDPCHTHALPVVPLAIVRWDRFARGAASRILAVDNCAIRPLAPGVPAVRALVQAITLCTSPGPRPPRFVALTPAHRGELAIEPGATSARIVARASMPITAPNAVGWTLDIYREGNGDVLRYSNTTLPVDLFNVALAVENDAAGRPVDLSLRFSALGPNAPLKMPPGTYVWRINMPGSELAARVTGTPLDGEPAAIRAVPSGDGRPGGVFESRFFVRQRPANA